MKSFLIIFIFIFVFFQCRSRNTLEREIILSETLDTRSYNDKCALFINRNCEISLEEVKEEFLEKFLNSKLFKENHKEFHNIRKELIYFIIVIANTGEKPIGISNIQLKYNNKKTNTITAQYLKQNYPLYNDSMFNLFEINSEDLCIKDTEFFKDIKKYEKKIIEPGLKVMKIIAFNWIPVQYRKFDISLKVKSDIIQKIVDFKFIRFEYRHSGNHFVKPGIDND